FFSVDQRVEQHLQGEDAAVVVDVKGADTGSEVDDAGDICGTEMLCEHVDAEAEVEIEDEGAVFDKQVLVAVEAVDDGRACCSRRHGVQDGGESFNFQLPV